MINASLIDTTLGWLLNFSDTCNDGTFVWTLGNGDFEDSSPRLYSSANETWYIEIITWETYCNNEYNNDYRE